LAFSIVAVGIVPSQARAEREKQERREKKDPREMKAREAFAAGSYQDALEIYTKLYAEKLHPTYLRNIGRCYQNLNEPDRAISSFREYLRKAKDVTADERAEVEGYIREMEELQRKNAAAAAPMKPEPRPLPEAAPPVNPGAPAQPLGLVQQPAPTPAPSGESGPAPFYKRAWFWGLVGGVVVAGTAGGLWAGGVFSAKSHNACPAGFNCSTN
jgi:hypothetical protein